MEHAYSFAGGADGTGGALQDGAATADFDDLVERIRQKLRTTLARVQAVETLPWPNLAKTCLAGWLPGEEAEALEGAFGREMKRRYRAAGKERPERATS